MPRNESTAVMMGKKILSMNGPPYLQTTTPMSDYDQIMPAQL